MMRFVDEDMVRSVLRYEDLIPAMRQTMIDFSLGVIQQPARRILEVVPYGGYFGSMPAISPGALGAKLVTFYPGNVAKNLDTHMALIVLFRPETGEPLVVMDGHLITEMRTAAVTAAFVDEVVAQDVNSLAVLGAGVQAKSHIEALSHVRRFAEIRIWNRTASRAAELAGMVGGRAVSREDAVRGADVVVVATSSPEPVLDGKWLKRGAKVASVGWSGRDGAELDAATMSNTVIVDSREGAHTESGNVRRHQARIFAELGEVFAGEKEPNLSETVVFDSIGMACQDVVAAGLVCQKIGCSA